MHIHFFTSTSLQRKRTRKSLWMCVCATGRVGGAPDVPQKLELGPVTTISFFFFKFFQMAICNNNMN